MQGIKDPPVKVKDKSELINDYENIHLQPQRGKCYSINFHCMISIEVLQDKQKSVQLKERGNEEYKSKNYNKAID